MYQYILHYSLWCGNIIWNLGLVLAWPTLYRGLGKQECVQRKHPEELKTTQYKKRLKEQIVLGGGKKSQLHANSFYYLEMSLAEELTQAVTPWVERRPMVISDGEKCVRKCLTNRNNLFLKRKRRALEIPRMCSRRETD